MRKYIFLFALCLPAIAALSQIKDSIEVQNPFPLNLGSSRSFYSNLLKEERIINIYLPPDYNLNDSITYPVIYLLDGSAKEDYFHVTALVDFLSMYNIIPESIVIGISNVDRKRDFTFPTSIEQDKIDFPTTGGSENFIGFMEHELIPLIEKNYKSSKEKTIIGQSLGGLLAIEVLVKKPYLFSTYLIVSPSVWWDNESLLKEKETLSASNDSLDITVSVSVGNEGETMVNGSKKLVGLLEQMNNANINSSFHYFPDENHATILHIALYEAFKTLYIKESHE